MDNGNVRPETHAKAHEFSRIFASAVHRVQEENRQMGVPNVYGINGHIYYELPDGTLSLEDPYVEQAREKPADGE